MKELIIKTDLLNGKNIFANLDLLKYLILVTCVTKLLHSTHPYKNMQEYMIRKNLSDALMKAVTKRFHK